MAQLKPKVNMCTKISMDMLFRNSGVFNIVLQFYFIIFSKVKIL